MKRTGTLAFLFAAALLLGFVKTSAAVGENPGDGPGFGGRSKGRKASRPDQIASNRRCLGRQSGNGY